MGKEWNSVRGYFDSQIFKIEDVVSMSNEKYNYYQKLHPEWSEEQIWAAVSIDMNAAKEINERGNDVSPNDPDLIKAVLDGARDWLREVLPNVFVKVQVFFDKLILSIGEWVQKGLSYVLELISKTLGKN